MRSPTASGQAPDPRLLAQLVRANRLAAAMLGVSLALVIAFAYYSSSRPQQAVQPGAANAELSVEEREQLKQAALDQLISRGVGIWDSHPDSQVGRVLLTGLDGAEMDDIEVESNSMGLREREYSLPKPANTLRIVLLGDSFVFGERVDADERFGARLEEYLSEKAILDGRTIEVLHLGLGSWNFISESNWGRRQLSLLQPDLVVLLTVINDLDDSDGVRGFGSKANFSPLRRSHANARVTTNHAVAYLGFRMATPLHEARDYESRQRFAEAKREVHKLEQLCDDLGTKFLLLVHWGARSVIVQENIVGDMDAEQVAYLPSSFAKNMDYWADPNDSHWNAKGHELVSRILYGWIRSQDLFPELQLESWPEAEDYSRVSLEEGLYESTRSIHVVSFLNQFKPEPILRLDALTDHSAAQLYAGVWKGGVVGPYVSLVLRAEAVDTLYLEGAALDRPELNGARVKVWVEEFALGSFEIKSGQPISFSAALPEEARQRTIVNVRLESDDFVYSGADLRECVVFNLAEIGLR